MSYRKPKSTLKLFIFSCIAVIAFGAISAEAKPPSADFTWYVDGLWVYFQDLSAGDPDTWLWDFGDGTGSARQNPLHTYIEAGTYEVTLTASSDFGLSQRVKVLVISGGGGDAPYADFSWTVDGLTAEFTDLSIGPVDSWQWDFGDGGFSAEQNPVHTFAEVGVYDVELRVANNYGYSVRTIQVAVGASEAPRADFRWTVEGHTVTFSDRSAGQIDSWLWGFGDGNGSLTPSPTYTFSGPGAYDVTLEVGNDFGTSLRTYEVSVEGFVGEPALADFRWLEGAALSVYFEDLSIGQVESRLWTFGDGDLSVEVSPLKIYPEAGTYEVNLTVSNRYGQTTRTQHVTVGEPEGGDAPRADFGWSIEGLIVFLEDRSLGEIDSRLWTFGDGAESTEENPSHAYAAEGTYEIELTVTNEWGSSSRAVEITIGDAPDDGWLQFISGASLAAGAEGSFWITELDINNTSSQVMTYFFMWLPRGQDNSEPRFSETLTLGAGQSRRFDNVLAEAFGFTPEDAPFGSIAIAGSTSQYLSMARVYNQPSEGEGGTVGQAFPGVPYDRLVKQGDKQRLILMTENEDFRSNVGCQNGALKPIVVSFAFYDDRGIKLGETTMTLQAASNQQINRVLEPFAPVKGYIDIWSETPDSLFFCFGSVLDNITSDPTTVLTK